MYWIFVQRPGGGRSPRDRRRGFLGVPFSTFSTTRYHLTVAVQKGSVQILAVHTNIHIQVAKQVRTVPATKWDVWSKLHARNSGDGNYAFPHPTPNSSNVSKCSMARVRRKRENGSKRVPKVIKKESKWSQRRFQSSLGTGKMTIEWKVCHFDAPKWANGDPKMTPLRTSVGIIWIWDRFWDPFWICFGVKSMENVIKGRCKNRWGESYENQCYNVLKITPKSGRKSMKHRGIISEFWQPAKHWFLRHVCSENVILQVFGGSQIHEKTMKINANSMLENVMH